MLICVSSLFSVAPVSTGAHLYEPPHVKPPPPLFLFFLPSWPFSCSTAPQAFSRPDRIFAGPARADAVKAGRFFSGHHPLEGLAFTAIEHDGRLDGSGSSTLLSVIYLS
jgi:hypothetical protein